MSFPARGAKWFFVWLCHFPTRLKSKKVEIGKEKMSQLIVKEKLSERAVVKENGLG